MAKQKVTTKTTKRFRYSSFRARIDDLRIEPARNLTKRVHDYVETSHFLASFDHWKDINMSADFTSFSFEVQNIVQTLPQILYHADTIFNALLEHIDKQDNKSLQPLLDLLAQFCHDLGPDFTKYYERAVTSLIKLLDEAIKFESPDVFEWGFNCLAYIFKYLSRVLTDDLIPTFDMLLPLLSNPKEYLSRFSAEALSFLIRKSNAKKLLILTSHFFDKLNADDENSNLYDGLLTLFTEAIISTPGSLHSKSSAIINVLFEQAFTRPNVESCTTLICDVWMNISKHAEMEALTPVTSTVVECLTKFSNQQNGSHIIKIVSTMVYAESGRKIDDWSMITKLIDNVTQNTEKGSLHADNISFLFAVLLRNADVRCLTQYHKTIFETIHKDYPSHFLQFFSFCQDLTLDRLTSFNGPKYLNKYIEENWKNDQEGISLYLLQLHKNDRLSSKIIIKIPIEFANNISESLKKYCSGVLTTDDLYEIYWRCIVLKYSETVPNSVLLELIKILLNSTTFSSNKFNKDIIGCLIEILSDTECEELTILFPTLISEISQNMDSIFYIRGLNHLLKIMKNDDKLLTILFENQDTFVRLGDNLSVPNPQLRSETITLLMTAFEFQNIEIPRYLQEIKLLEDIPLTLQNARDITTRIRNAGKEFSKSQAGDIMGNFFIKYMFGLLTIRFSPIWDGVYEIIPDIYNKDADLIWKFIYTFLNITQKPDESTDIEETLQDDEMSLLWTSHVTRLESALHLFSTAWKKYTFNRDTIISVTKENRGPNEYPPQIRMQVLTLLSKIPMLAERNSKDFVPFLFNDMESRDLFEENEAILTSTSTWYETDKNLLLKILSDFKNIKNIFKSAEVFDKLMRLLGSRTVDVQKLALNALFCFKSPTIVKYRDNLNSLLDDTLFKDEVTKFLSDNDTKVISFSEEDEIMPYILRILYGRAQTPPTSGIKKSRKVAVLSVLPNLREEFIINFFQLGSHGFAYDYFFDNNYQIEQSEVTTSNLRRMTGFINIINMSLVYLGSNFPQAIGTIIKPLLYTIAMSYTSAIESDNTEFETKLTTNLRQQSLKCLNTIFQTLEEKYDWSVTIPEIYEIVLKPRLALFATENLQQPSSLLKVIIFWTKSPSYYKFLYYDNFAVARVLMETLTNEHAKESVVNIILDGSNEIISKQSRDDEYIDLVSIVASSCLQILPQLYDRMINVETMSKAVELLLNMTEAGYVQSNETRKYLLDALQLIIEKNFKKLKSKDTIKLLKVISVLVSEYECPWEDVERLYKDLSGLFTVFTEKDQRIELSNIFSKIGGRFGEFEPVATLVSDFNSYSSRRMNEYDFPRILSAFKRFTETQYKLFSDLQWLPILYNCLYFINDKDELALRTNASHCLKLYADHLNEEYKINEKVENISTFKDTILPALCDGLRRYTEDVHNEYISIVSYYVETVTFYKGLDDMKVLLFKGDEEANFFTNITHIQLHRRQRAVKRLREYSSSLSDNSVSHYLIPIIEHYVFSEEDKYRNIGNEALLTIGILSGKMSWKQYRALLRRYISFVKANSDKLKQSVLLINEISKAMKNTLLSLKEPDNTSFGAFSKIPKSSEELISFVKDDLYPTLTKILAIRDEETIIARIPLSEALVNFILGLEHDDIVNLLPGILTKICQILRSKASELRDAVRSNLAKITNNVGAKYLFFIIKELKSALQRGSQVHVLGYTVHHIIRSLYDHLDPGDLDDSASLTVAVIMEDIFGSTGKEKESDNYHTKMIEVKVNHSYDTGEVLASNISLSAFDEILTPVKALLTEHINLKTQKKLEELLRRYALGINHNKACQTQKILSLCYEIFEQSKDDKPNNRKNKNNKVVSEKEEFFLVNLNAKNTMVHKEDSLYTDVMQKFSLDLLRTVLSRNKVLLNVQYLAGFVPLLSEALKSENEDVLTSALRVLVILIKLDFTEESEALFKNCARKVLNLIKDSPSTSNDLCQMGLKFLSSFIRHKDIKLKDTALSYVLMRVLPDLNEPSKQGLAFNFLKALVSKHIMLPELYDIIGSVREIMITNHSRDIRNVARTVYYQFLMEYDQSKGRLEKQFKFMVDNLQYPSPDGRQSVMELINLIITKSSPELLSKLSSSFFISLANVSFNDDNGKCREMSAVLLSRMFLVLDDKNMVDVDKYIGTWLKQSDNATFLNLGMRIYKIYVSSLGIGKNADLEQLARSRIQTVLNNTHVGSDTNWDLIYSALNLYATFIEKVPEEEFSKATKNLWNDIVSCLLYPHTWVRQASGRLVYELMNHLDIMNEKFSAEDIQNIASRVLHQLAAPSISEGLSSIAVKTLIKITMIWNENNTPYYKKEDVDEEQNNQSTYLNAIDYMIVRVSKIIRSEHNPADSFMSKKAAIQFFALVVQILSAEQVTQEAEKIILALYTHLESDRGRLSEEQEELSNLSQECLQMVESKISVSAFTEAYTNVKQVVIRRREERRAKRSIMTINEPELAAQKKLRKHARSREKRKHEKDDNGFYQRKNKRKRT
ncbi:similar to Saccharomyces cerevisiae YBL004W UTP20 Component of the small-subunit (SSU) processome, which is involved in the biogenesis of the 18S rRNA [Maudiozyma saulgeensis]|uniref:Similar to Saccharomyces cerevisiae YBL004W UTP20 Component of the small-subunit (SSU) processome, which is involved in the biogenesis of the 18S rRNA n=1 Tax=Maudiozyma saulgeensis TaxID=1789683 RepID=A0A1X7R3M7_9SACH|nr:similar to Saccharomyces cerevisiae YBL004W UTP20 Component of the small-subunit (SSU) processome, which is involved in the biogenesis of the 18S rRNA [Kazachstania saulgeensis]